MEYGSEQTQSLANHLAVFPAGAGVHGVSVLWVGGCTHSHSVPGVLCS